jgi:hypothetical protein
MGNLSQLIQNSLLIMHKEQKYREGKDEKNVISSEKS